MKRSGLGLAFLLWAAIGAVRGAEVMPPAPANYFNDYAGLVRTDTATRLNTELEAFEQTTSNQIVVAIFPKMESDSSVEDYTVRVAQSWRVGQKARNNGTVLFIFVASHQMYIQVGYGLEGALPDARCKDIISDLIAPAFKRQAYDQGVTAGVEAMLAAARGEYHGTGQTVARRHGQNLPPIVPIIVFAIILLFTVFRRRYYVYTPGGFIGGGWGGGSGGGGGGGGFSGGGGSFGGGGAGGSW